MVSYNYVFLRVWEVWGGGGTEPGFVQVLGCWSPANSITVSPPEPWGKAIDINITVHLSLRLPDPVSRGFPSGKIYNPRMTTASAKLFKDEIYCLVFISLFVNSCEPSPFQNLQGFIKNNSSYI